MRSDWNDIPIFPMGIESYSNDTVRANFTTWKRENPDLPAHVVCLFDAWTMPEAMWKDVPVIGAGALKASEAAAAYGAEVSARGAGNTSAGSAVLLPKLADSAANIASAAKTASEVAPQMEQSTAFSDLIDKLKAQATETQTATREKLTTEKPAGLGIEGLTRKEGGFTSMGNQLSSLQKVGGGGSMIGGAAIDYSRQQLDEQKRSNQFLGVIATALTTREMGITPYGALA